MKKFVQSNEICNNKQHYNGNIYDGMFCAGDIENGGKDACQDIFRNSKQSKSFFLRLRLSSKSCVFQQVVLTTNFMIKLSSLF